MLSTLTFFLRKLTLLINRSTFFFLRYSRLYRTVRKQGQTMEIYIFCETQWRWPWYVESTLMKIVYINILFAILPFWISKENAAWCWLVTLGSSSLDRNHPNLEICLLLFLFKSLLVALELLLVVPWCLQKLAQTLSFFKILCYWHSKIQIKLQKLPIGLKFHIH